ncbi:MAG: acetylornithine/succinylornithine family transaminase, partial [Oscillospiraceae bacterium]
GKSYIDFSSGIGVNSFGYCDKEWTTAVKSQLDKLAHMSNLYYTQPGAELAKALCLATGMKKVFFANSGAEANEGAIKTARKYSADKYSSDRYEIITLVNSFHGRTITTLAATGQDHFHQKFQPLTQGFIHATANDIADLTAKVSNKTCAIMLEVIQGEGGVIPLDHTFVSAAAKLCADNDLILIIDEVQTGIGRTGKLFAYEHFDIKPDIVTMAKGLGGGLPIGGIIFGEKTENVLGTGDHATTFGANPIVCAGALTVVNRMTDEFLQNVTAKGDYIFQRLSSCSNVKSVSGMGMMVGIELKNGTSKAAVEKCIQNGLIALTAKEKIRLLPPLNISKEELKQGVYILCDVIQSIR